MNRNKLKQYAPQARRDFIAAVTDRAAYYGLTKQKIEPITEQGDVALIGGKPFPRDVAAKRKRLEGHIKQRGFEQVMEAMAYTWFNRLVAIRFMELHGYLDHGYRARDIPALILQKNLFGLEIDDRAAQLAAFALMMKARADDRRIFDSEAKPNILAFHDSRGMDATDITHALNAPINKEDVPSEYLFEEVEEEKAGLFGRKALAEMGHVSQGDIGSLMELFENAKTLGSLIQIPPKLAARRPEIEQRLNDVLKYGDLTHASAQVIKPLLQQARFLSRRYDAVVANPPYMGGKYFTGALKDFVAENYKDAKADLYACFIQRNLAFAKPNGFVGMITIPNWMFLSSFESVRKSLFDKQAIDTFIHNGRGVFGSDFGSCSFVLRNHSLPKYKGTFRRLFDKQGSVASNEELADRFFRAQSHVAAPADFLPIPSFPLAYWISSKVRDVFTRSRPLGEVGTPRQGVATADNNRFLRRWYEVPISESGFSFTDSIEAAKSGKRWFPHNKGGDYRKWAGNLEYLVNWQDDGREIRNFTGESGRVLSRPQNTEFFSGKA